jgi:hypothetical protein
MGLYAVHALHHRARCDACGATSDVHCSEALPHARADAMKTLLATGWSHAVGVHESPSLRTWFRVHGVGTWRCPACTRNVW